MPGRDMTGPLGRGPMTGRGLGYCAGFSELGRLARSHIHGFGGFFMFAGVISLGALLISRKLKHTNL